MSEPTAPEQHAHHAHHVTPISKLAWTYGFLVVMMALTVIAARLPLDMPETFGWVSPLFWVTNAVALGIAIFKAAAVVQTFMGVKYTTKLVKLFAYGGFVWFLTLFIMFIDYGTRKYEPVRGWESGVPSTAFPRERTSDAGIPYPVYEGSHGAAHDKPGGGAKDDGHGLAPGDGH